MKAQKSMKAKKSMKAQKSMKAKKRVRGGRGKRRTRGPGHKRRCHRLNACMKEESWLEALETLGLTRDKQYSFFTAVIAFEHARRNHLRMANRTEWRDQIGALVSPWSAVQANGDETAWSFLTAMDAVYTHNPSKARSRDFIAFLNNTKTGTRKRVWRSLDRIEKLTFILLCVFVRILGVFCSRQESIRHDSCVYDVLPRS